MTFARSLIGLTLLALATLPGPAMAQRLAGERPADIAARRAANSASVPIVEPRIESCFQKMCLISSSGFGPDVAPAN